MLRGKSVLALAICTAILLSAVAVAGTSTAGGSSCFERRNSRLRSMRGDVDGDGTKDLAFLTARKPGGKCRYYVKVDFGTGHDRKRLRGDRFTLRNNSRLAAMVDVDTVAGKEFGVVLAQGASTAFMGLFTIRGGDIRRIHVEGAGAPPEDLFGYGGSISFQTASDCARRRPPGTVIYSTAEYRSRSDRYDVKRRWFASTGTDLQRTAEPTQRERVKPRRLHRRFYEFRNNPFGSCRGRVRG